MRTESQAAAAKVFGNAGALFPNEALPHTSDGSGRFPLSSTAHAAFTSKGAHTHFGQAGLGRPEQQHAAPALSTQRGIPVRRRAAILICQLQASLLSHSRPRTRQKYGKVFLHRTWSIAMPYPACMLRSSHSPPSRDPLPYVCQNIAVRRR